MSVRSTRGAAREGRRKTMDEKKTADQEETVPQDHTLTDREAEEASGGRLNAPSWAQRGVYEGTKRGKLDGAK